MKCPADLRDRVERAVHSMLRDALFPFDEIVSRARAADQVERPASWSYEKQVRWDILHEAQRLKLIHTRELYAAGLNDNHIDTVLRASVRSFKVK